MCANSGARRSCCSTAAAGRTSSPVAPAGGCGAARTATSRSCCTGARATSPAITAATASPRPSAASSAARSRSHATAPAPSASSTIWRSALDGGRRTSASRCCASTPTRSAPMASPRCCAASRRPSRGVLVGTQMVAKGHDFPDVTLGVVLDADATLRFPDFRAEERTFALIAQLAGRVGRGGDGARARADDRARGPRDHLRRTPRQRRLPRGRAGTPRGAALPAVLAPDQDRVLGRRERSRARGGRRAGGAAVRSREPTRGGQACSDPQHCSGCAVGAPGARRQGLRAPPRGARRRRGRCGSSRRIARIEV